VAFPDHNDGERADLWLMMLDQPEVIADVTAPLRNRNVSRKSTPQRDRVPRRASARRAGDARPRWFEIGTLRLGSEYVFMPECLGLRSAMSPALSVYLDLIRFTAAFVVFLCHVSGGRLTGGLRGLWHLDHFADNAVIAFFVLSGFVIAYVAENRENMPQTYAISRIARIYSVALPALIATFVLDAIGRAIDPSAYSIAWGYVDHGRLWQFLSGLLCLNQLWFSNVPQGSNLPYWSLGFEVWYYLIFGLAVFSPLASWRWAAVLAALAVVGPRVALLFPIWLLGVGCYRYCSRASMSPRSGLLVWIGTIAAYVAYVLLLQQHLPQQLQSLTVDRYIVGACFAVNIAGFQSMSPLVTRWISGASRPIRWLAGATFTLYLFHLPVAQFLSVLAPSPATSVWRQLFVVGGTLIIIFVVAQHTERRKEQFRHWIETGYRLTIGMVHFSLRG
jgi:peptidoglycan/LPS O-acetylase OafA/YrhL